MPALVKGTAAYKKKVKEVMARNKAATPPAAAAPAAPLYDPFSSPTYLAGQNNANTQYGSTLANIENQVRQGASDIGATLQRDGANNVTGANIDYNTIDVTNPFSKAALLKRSYDQQREGTTNSLAAGGQLYSGALLNARNNNQFGYEQNQDSLSKSLQNMLMEAQQGREGAANNRASDLYNTYLSAIQSAPGV